MPTGNRCIRSICMIAPRFDWTPPLARGGGVRGHFGAPADGRRARPVASWLGHGTARPTRLLAVLAARRLLLIGRPRRFLPVRRARGLLLIRGARRLHPAWPCGNGARLAEQRERHRRADDRGAQNLADGLVRHLFVLL